MVIRSLSRSVILRRRDQKKNLLVVEGGLCIYELEVGGGKNALAVGFDVYIFLRPIFAYTYIHTYSTWLVRSSLGKSWL